MTADFVHRFIPGAMASAPTILTLHSTAGDENELVPLARMVDGDAAILAVRGRVIEKGRLRFFRRTAKGEPDRDDLRSQTEVLARFLDEASARYRFGRDRVVVLAYSNGATIAANLILSVDGALAGGVLFRAMIPFEPEPARRLNDMPIFLSAGKKDHLISAADAERLAELLRARGARVTLEWQDTGHALSPREIEDATAWWQDTIGADGPGGGA